MTIKTPFILAAAATAALALPAYAGSNAPAQPDPVVPQPAPAAPVGFDWTGGYVGGQLGYGSLDTGTADDGGAIGGVHAGYDFDFGQWVVGAGLDYDFADITAGGITLDNVARLKVRGGYDLGNGGLAYATAGGARAYTASSGDDDGYFFGAGYEHMVTDTFSVSGELLHHQFDNFGGGGTDIDANTVQVRGSFRF
ncbi:outer membrane protein [Sediminimonas qiaohouensis]|uniref:outer membrane protein n=1 Tax=Sediminimonas qiaohouensis TaxID=552061 RepID=UPI0004233C8D|nr:outer membrane beta-barrel protein [Sediminimonas qiaohouensis]